MGCSEAGRAALREGGIGPKVAKQMVEELGFADPGDLIHITQVCCNGGVPAPASSTSIHVPYPDIMMTSSAHASIPFATHVALQAQSMGACQSSPSHRSSHSKPESTPLLWPQELIGMLNLKPIEKVKLQKLVDKANSGMVSPPGVSGSGALMTQMPLVRPPSASMQTKGGGPKAAGAGSGGTTSSPQKPQVPGTSSAAASPKAATASSAGASSSASGAKVAPTAKKAVAAPAATSSSSKAAAPATEAPRNAIPTDKKANATATAAAAGVAPSLAVVKGAAPPLATEASEGNLNGMAVTEAEEEEEEEAGDSEIFISYRWVTQRRVTQRSLSRTVECPSL